MMLREEQALIRDMTRKFAAERLAPGAAERDRTRTFPRAELREMAELGLMGLVVPTQWDGAGADYVSLVAAIEEIAAADGAISTILCVQGLAYGVIMRWGSDAQKEKYLKPLARGEVIGAFGLTEPGAGSDAAAIATTATRQGDYYVLNGSKQFITSGHNGGLVVVFAVTDPKAGKKGISAFIVPTDTPGYNADRLEEKMGQHCSDTAQIVFDNCKIPAENLIGAEGEGYKMALGNLETGRLCIAAQCVGMARAAYEHALAYAQERQTFGTPIIGHQAVGFRLADMATRVEVARHMTLHAAALKDAGQPCLKEACMAKLTASENGEAVCRDAIQTFGGYGYISDYPVERIYRDIRIGMIYEGTSDIQRLIITKQIQG